MDEYTAAQALRLPSGPSQWPLLRRWSSRTNREVTEDSLGTTKGAARTLEDGPRIMDGSATIDGDLATTDGGLETTVDGLGGMEGLAITDEATRTPSPTCC